MSSSQLKRRPQWKPWFPKSESKWSQPSPQMKPGSPVSPIQLLFGSRVLRSYPGVRNEHLFESERSAEAERCGRITAEFESEPFLREKERAILSVSTNCWAFSLKAGDKKMIDTCPVLPVDSLSERSKGQERWQRRSDGGWKMTENQRVQRRKRRRESQWRRKLRLNQCRFHIFK